MPVSVNKYRRQNRISKEKLIAPAAAAGVTAIGAVGYYSGVLPELLDSQLSLNPRVLDGAVDGMVTVNETIRQSSPVIALSMIAMLTTHKLKAKVNPRQHTLDKLSHIEYSGIDDIVDSQEKKSKFTPIKKAVGGVALVSATLIMATTGLEKEVSNGPNRPTEAMIHFLSQEDSNPLILLEESESDTSSNLSLMAASSIPEQKMDKIIRKATSEGAQVAPFNRDFMSVNGRSAMEFSIPNEVFEAASDVEIDQSCSTVPVIVDSTLGAKAGEIIDINGTSAQVVKVESGIAQMNRNIVLLADTDMKDCLKEGTDNSYFGAVISGSSMESVSGLIEDNDLTGVSVITKEQFFENNRDFWRANGTPIILILMGSVAVLGGAAVANERRSALQRNAREIGMFNAAGVSMKDIQSIETRRALRESLYATALATPLGVGVSAAFNASVGGLSTSIDARGVAVAAVVTGASSLIASQRAVKGFSKQLDITQAVKG